MNELEIKVLTTERLVSVSQMRPPLLETAHLVTLGTPVKGHLQILTSMPAYLTIDAHATSDLRHEVGGFLVGRPYAWDGQLYVEIVDALPGEQTRSGAAHLTIMPETWSQAQQTARAKFPGLYLVGWYHTHPRMSVFMSAQDLAIHEGFFQEPWHVSLVIEPVSREAGFFVWERGVIRAANSYQIAYPSPLPEHERWQMPSSRTIDLDALPPTLDEFYQPGSYRTRWDEPDELAVRVSEEAIAHVTEWQTSGSGLAIGLCLGRLRLNYQGVKPFYFVDVRAITSLIPIDRHINLTVDSIARRVKSVIEALESSDAYTLVGWYLPEVVFQAMSLPVLKMLHYKLFTKPWQVALIEATGRTEPTCIWWDSSLQAMTRPLYKVVAFSPIPSAELDALAVRAVDEHRRWRTASESETDSG